MVDKDGKIFRPKSKEKLKCILALVVIKQGKVNKD